MLGEYDRDDYNYPGKPIDTEETTNELGERVVIYRYSNTRPNQVTYKHGGGSSWSSVPGSTEKDLWQTKPSTLLWDELVPETADKQVQSSLFSKLPPEIRQEIYKLVLEQYQNRSQPYPSDAFYWRPSFKFPWYTHTSILYTCRLAYLEAATLAIQQATHFIWAAECPKRTESLPASSSVNCTTGLGLQHFPYIRHLRCFGIIDEMVDRLVLHMSFPLPDEEPRALAPETIHCIVSHTNWLDWEYGVVPSLYEDGMQVCEKSFPANLKEFRVTFESLDKFKDGINRVADLAKSKWKILRKDDVKLSAEGLPIVVEQPWVGPHSAVLKERWLNSGNLSPDPVAIDELTYYGVTVTFRPEKTASFGP